MRTTLTLEDELAERLAEVARDQRKAFKVVVNDLIRKALDDLEPPESQFVLKPWSGQLRPGIDERRFNETLWELEEDRALLRTKLP